MPRKTKRNPNRYEESVLETRNFIQKIINAPYNHMEKFFNFDKKLELLWIGPGFNVVKNYISSIIYRKIAQDSNNRGEISLKDLNRRYLKEKENKEKFNQLIEKIEKEHGSFTSHHSHGQFDWEENFTGDIKHSYFSSGYARPQYNKMYLKNPKLTFLEAKEKIAKFGLTLRKNEWEQYEIIHKGVRGAIPLYETNDLVDAVNTAKHLSRK